MSFPGVPLEALSGGRESSQPGSLYQKWLLCMLFLPLKSVLLASPAIPCSIPVACNISIDQRNEPELSKIFSVVYTFILLVSHLSHAGIEKFHNDSQGYSFTIPSLYVCMYYYYYYSLILLWYLLCTRHYNKHFPLINSFNLQNNQGDKSIYR